MNFKVGSHLFLFFFRQILNLYKAERYQIQKIENPTMYRLSTLGDTFSEREEAMCVIHGIIIEKDLPPINIAKSVIPFRLNFFFF
jgi:hypothetical protein